MEHDQKIFKPLTFFILAANSLLGAGFLSSESFHIQEWVFLAWSTFTGIFLTYRFNDLIDADLNLRFDSKKFFSNKAHLLMSLQTIFFLAPVSIYYISKFRITILLITGILGFLYSVKFSYKGKTFRLKHIFLVKNILIGTCWGTLVLVGSNNIDTASSKALFVFATLQVFVGSSIRDLTDIDQDQKEKVNSLPVVLGAKNTLIFLGAINIFSILIFYLISPSLITLIPAVLTIIWRQITLFKISSKSNLKFWTQKINLLTCFIIFIGQLIVWML